MAIKVNGRLKPSIADAAAHFGVTTKAVRAWIDTGVISPPPKEAKGQGFVEIFEAEYLAKADAELDAHRKNGSAKRSKK